MNTYVDTYIRRYTHTRTHTHTHHLGDDILHEQFANEKKVLEDNRRPHPLYSVHFGKVEIECLHTANPPGKRRGKETKEKKRRSKW
jgi:hypothetical protein